MGGGVLYLHSWDWINSFLPAFPPSSTRIPYFPSKKKPPQNLDFTPNWCIGWEFPSHFLGPQHSLLEGAGECSQNSSWKFPNGNQVQKFPFPTWSWKFAQIPNFVVDCLGFFELFGVKGQENRREAHSQSGICDGLGILGASGGFSEL